MPPTGSLIGCQPPANIHVAALVAMIETRMSPQTVNRRMAPAFPASANAIGLVPAPIELAARRSY